MLHLVRHLGSLLLVLSTFAAQAPRDLRLEWESITPPAPGKSTRWALVVGVSQYANLPPHQQLRYAHRDAEQFADFLKSPSGGAFPDRQVRLLTDQQATLAAIRAALEEWLAAGTSERDVVYLFFAGHGVVAERDAGYFLAHDSDPQNLSATALPFAEVNAALSSRIRASMVVLLADACHAGKVGWTSEPGNPSTAQSAIESISAPDRTFLKLLASRPSERSYEDARWNGGQGVFTFALLEGLRGHADRDRDGVVRASELIDHMALRVPQETTDRQHPRVAGNFEPRIALSVTRGLPVSTPPARSAALQQLETLIREGRVLGSGGAWEHFRGNVFSPTETGLARTTMATALDQLGQTCVNDYVQSTRVALKRLMLLDAANAYEALAVLRPHDRQIESKRNFCLARAEIAAGQFAEAESHLRVSLRINPEFACAYNALGVALDRQRRTAEAQRAFEQAARLTPEWGLPYLQLGQLLLAGGQTKLAVPYLERASRFNPPSVISHWTLLRAYRLTGTDDGVERMRRVLAAVNPNYPPTYLELAQWYESRREYARAAEALDAYLQLAPNFADSAATRERSVRLRSLANRPVPSLLR